MSTEPPVPVPPASATAYGVDDACFHPRPGRRLLLATVLAGVAAALMLTGAVAQGRPLRVVALGDSLTAGYMLPASAAFPAVLERSLRARGLAVEIANAGVSGDTASQGLDRLDWSVPDGTDAVIVELGANDALRGIDPAVTRKALETIITRLKGRGIAVMLAGMYAPRNMGAEYVAAFDGLFPDLAGRHGVPLYPFFLDGIAGDGRYVMKDGLHPTADGIKIVVERILPSVERFLGSLPRG